MCAASQLQLRVAVYCDRCDTDARSRAREIAEQLSLPVVTATDDAAAMFDLYLVVTDDRLTIRDVAQPRSRPMVIDFSINPPELRRGAESIRRQPLARAVGIGRGPVALIDATAGLGGDAFLLARWGCVVTAVERSTVLHALLADALRRAATCSMKSVREASQRISLSLGDARTVLGRGAKDRRWDVAFLDPMYPERTKSAASRKELKVCRMLVGDDADAAELLDIARRSVRKRVVVKRHRHAPPLAPDPSHSHHGRSVRYDVYPVIEP